MKNLLLLLFVLFVFESCISLKKYRNLESNYFSLKGQNMVLRDSLNETHLLLNQLEQDNKICLEKISDLQNDTSVYAVQIKYLTKQIADCQNTVQVLSHDASKEIERKTWQILELQNKLNDKEKGLELLAAELEIQQLKLNDNVKNLEEKEKQLNLLADKLNELETSLKNYQLSVKNLKSKVMEALLGINNSGLSVSEKNNKVYISLEENLLFQSGSTKIDKKGEQALLRLSKLLEENKDINIMVEGHTDSIPYHSSSGCIKNNWQLSVLRAVTVSEIILKNKNIDPSRIIPCGRADSFPISTNDTETGRAKNRRTEIILFPKLDELFKIIESE